MLWLLRAAGKNLGIVAYLLGVRRSVVEENLRHAFPEWSNRQRNRISRASYRNLGQVFLEFVFLRFAREQDVRNGLKINNLESVNHLLSKGTGAILLSGHLGNWEWLAMGCGLALDESLHVIVKNQKSSNAERFLNRMRSRFGNSMIDAGDVRSIFRALKDGKKVAILADQAAPAESVSVPFFGRSVPTFEGPARFALRTGQPMFLLQPAERTPTGYDCIFHEIDYSDLQGPTEDNVKELTTRHTALLERLIRERPELWLWHHRRWKYAQSN